MSGINAAFDATIAQLKQLSLDRSYWPATERRPFLRLGLGFALTPVLGATLFAGAAWAIYAATSGAEIDPTAEAWASFTVAFAAFAGVTVLGGVPAFAALWASRKRSAPAFALAGALIGLAETSLRVLFGQDVMALTWLVDPIVGVALMLGLRAIAGVTSACADDDDDEPI